MATATSQFHGPRFSDSPIPFAVPKKTQHIQPDSQRRCALQNFSTSLQSVLRSKKIAIFYDPFSYLAQCIYIVEQTQGLAFRNFLPWNPKFDPYQTGDINGITRKDLGDRTVVWSSTPHGRFLVAFLYAVSIDDRPSHLECMTVFQQQVSAHTNQLVASGYLNSRFSARPNQGLSIITQLFESATISQTRTDLSKGGSSIHKWTFSLPTHEQLTSLESRETISLRLW